MSVDEVNGIKKRCSDKVEVIGNADRNETADYKRYRTSDGSGSDEDDDSEYEEDSIEKLPETSAPVLQSGHSVPTEIHMDNTSDVHIGPHFNYNSPVTINQYVNVAGKVEQDVLEETVKVPLPGFDLKTDIAQATVTATEKPNGVIHLPEGTQQYNRTATNYNKVTSFFHHRRVYLILLSILIMAIIVIVVIIQFSSNSSGNNSQKSTTLFPPPKDPEPDPNMTLPGGRHIFTKKDWYGAEARYKKPLKHPTPFVVISHTATPACYTVVDCASQMRSFQDAHMGSDLQLPDIGYSFVVGGDGNVYEGRGWDATNMHTQFVTRCNIGISFIGNFVHDTPTEDQISAVQELIELGVELGKIAGDYKLVAMNETTATLSPGVVVYGIIKTWPHFWTPNENDVGVCPYQV